ncbi:hypothetical protein [Pseudomonas kurunegalensis]|uniref:Uncharacterized protein n=1 Tax=Pseudomonas kurunegalensis TaxID=485880 RepID=A0ACC5UPP6_9PSED|nr:hypothetical protein [Pseudomonas kurunegalensis]MBV4516389.1 hypothetical protein [Pseudomonas kurunegalensis]
MMLALKNRDERSIFLVAGNRDARYGSPKSTVNPVVGFGRPSRYRRNSAPYTIAGAFFVPAVTLYGGCVQDTFGCAGFLYLRSTNLYTAATHSFGRERGSSQSDTGATPMHALNPLKIRAYAHRRLALAALRADSSLATRLKRYNAAMAKARALEAQGGAQ